MFDQAKNLELLNPIYLEEIHKILKSIAKDKCPRPDRWMVEFFIHFFELVGSDLL